VLRVHRVVHEGHTRIALYDSADVEGRDHKIGDVFGSMQSDFDYDVQAEAQAAR